MIKVTFTIYLSVRYNDEPAAYATLMISEAMLLSYAAHETGRPDDGNEKMTLRWNAIRKI